MAERRPRTRVQEGGEEPAADADPAVPEGVHAGEQAVKAPVRDPARDHRARETTLDQLPTTDRPVLALGHHRHPN